MTQYEIFLSPEIMIIIFSILAIALLIINGFAKSAILSLTSIFLCIACLYQSYQLSDNVLNATFSVISMFLIVFHLLYLMRGVKHI